MRRDRVFAAPRFVPLQGESAAALHVTSPIPPRPRAPGDRVLKHELLRILKNSLPIPRLSSA